MNRCQVISEPANYQCKFEHGHSGRHSFNACDVCHEFHEPVCDKQDEGTGPEMERVACGTDNCAMLKGHKGKHWTYPDIPAEPQGEAPFQFKPVDCGCSGGFCSHQSKALTEQLHPEAPVDAENALAAFAEDYDAGYAKGFADGILAATRGDL